MRKSYFYVLVFLVLATLLPFDTGEAQVDEPWSDVEPVVSFGYGPMLSAYWSPINEQLAVASAQGFQFYDESMILRGERRFEEPVQGSILFSPDMELVALPEAGGLIIHNTKTWEPLLALSGYGSPSWSPDSRRLAVWAGGLLRVWDVYEAKVLLEISELVSFEAPVKWSPQGDVIALPGRGAIIMVETETGEIVRIHPFEQIVRFEWSADGRWFVVIGLKDRVPPDHDPRIPVMNELMLMDPISGDIVHRYDLNSGGRPGSVYGVEGFAAISPDGQYLAAPIRRWEPANPDPNAPDEEKQDRTVFAGMGIWHLESGEPLHDLANLPENLRNLTQMIWNPDGSHFAVIGGYTLSIYNTHSAEQVDITQAYQNSVSHVGWNERGQLLVAGGQWDLSTMSPEYLGAEPAPPPPSPGPDLEFLKPNPYVFDYNRPPYHWEVVHVYEDRSLVLTYEIDIEYQGTPEYEDEIDPEERYKIWDIETGTLLEERVYLKLQTAWLLNLDDSDIRRNENVQANMLASTLLLGIGDDEIVNLRESTETPLEITQTERWEYREVWFSPDGSRVFAYETDGTFKAFDPVTGRLLYRTVEAQRNSLQWVKDLSMFIVMDAEREIFVYDAETGDLLLQAYTGNQSPQLLWTDDLTYLAIGGENRGIALYHVPTRTRLTVLRGHQAPISGMSWNPDCDLTLYQTCRYLFASADASGRVIVWGVPHEAQLVQNLPEAPADPTLSTPVPAIDFSALTPLWTYITEKDQYGKPAIQSVRWSADAILVNDSFYYSEELTPLESEDIPRDAEWYRLEETAIQMREVENEEGELETVAFPLALERSGSLRDEETGRVLGNLNAGGMVYDAAFNADATIVFTAENEGGINEFSGWIGETVLYEHENQRPLIRWGEGNPGFNQIALAPDGSWLATATIPYYNSGGRGQIWHPTQRYQYASLIGHTEAITQLVWHPYDGTVITSSLDGSIRKWDMNGQQVARWNHATRAPVVQMEWAGSALLVSAGEDLYLINANDLSVIRTYRQQGGGVFDQSPDHSYVVTLGYDSVLRVVSLWNGRTFAEEGRHTPTLSNIAWHPSGDYLVVSRTDGSIIMLDSLTGANLGVLRASGPRLRSMEWDQAGERLLVDPVDEPYVEILDGDTGTVLLTIENQWRRPGVWWSPDGTRIAFGTYPDPNMGLYTSTSLVWIHDSRTGEALHQLSLDWDDYIWYWEKKPFYLNWSDTSNHIAAFYGKQRLRVWELSSYEGTILGTHYGIGRDFSFGLWNEFSFRFWTVDGHGEYVLQTDTLSYLSGDGLPQNTLMRPDGQVFLAGGQVLDRYTFYPLQEIVFNFNDAAWHPYCWSSDCPAMLAVSSGHTVTMYGFPDVDTTVMGGTE